MANAPLGMILSAGFGSRLLPLSLVRPKPIMEVAGKPIIYFLIKMMERVAIKDIVINLHHLPSLIVKRLAQEQITARLHFVYEKEILGTAGGVANAMKSLGVNNRGLILIHGDIFCDFDLAKLLMDPHFCSLVLDQDRKVDGYQGSVGVDESGQIVTLARYYRSAQNPVKNGFFTGIHYLSPRALLELKSSSADSLVAEVYPEWLKQGLRIHGHVEPLLYEDLGTPKRIYQANMSVLHHFERFKERWGHESFYEAGPKVYVEEGAQIDDAAKITGPVLIAKGAKLGKHAEVGPYAVIGQNCEVSSEASIRSSVVMSGTMIEKYERLNGSICLEGLRFAIKGGKDYVDEDDFF